MENESRQDAKEELKSIQGMLNEACVQFEKITKKKLDSRGFENAKSFDDLKARICSGKEADPQSRATRQKFLTIVSVVQTLTGPVKIATDIAFSPASACVSALSFLLEIPSKVHSIHESIRAVIEEVEPRFTELRVYDEMSAKIDPVLIISVCNVMMAFITLCAQCVKHLEKGKPYQYFKEGKWILSNKDPIKNGLDKLKELSLQKEHAQSMLMMKEILDSSDKLDNVGAKVDGISDYVSKRSDEIARQSDLSEIKKHFRVNSEDGVLMGHRVYEEASHIVGDKKCWFLESESYKTWAFNKEQDVRPLILISGEPGTGKSVLSASMFLDVKAKETFVVYYSFPPMPQSRKGHQQPLEDCVKVTGLQLAEQNSDYRRRLLHFLSTKEQSAEGTDYKSLLKTLNVWQAPDKMMICYLFLDGLDNLAESEFTDFMDYLTTNQLSSKENSLRVCVTGKWEILRKYSKLKYCLETAKMEDHNDGVIAEYIGKFLKRKDLLQEDFLDFAALRESICIGVTKNADGSFHKVQKWLDKIESLVQSDSRDELTRFLNTLSQGGSDLAESELRDLERILDSKEIAELNELIIWCEYHMSKDVIFGIEQLEAFLFIRSNSPPLRSLRKKIRDRFSLVLEEKDDGVWLREEMKQWVILQRDGHQQPAISATISVQNASIEVAQRFFWDLANHSVMNRFNFDANQIDMSKPSTHRIQVTKLNAHLVIVQRTFEFLRKAPDPLSRPIGETLLADLPIHLAVLQEPEQLEQLVDTDRRTIGENVQELFLSPTSLERHWGILQETRWHTDQSTIYPFWRWLSDDAAIKHPIIRDKIKEVRNDPRRNQKLFEPLAKLAGHKWLQDSSSSYSTASFEWLNIFLDMQDEDSDHASQSSETSSEENDDVENAEQWCKKALGSNRMRSKDVWVQRLAETYEYIGNYEKAQKKYQETAELLEKMGDVDRDRHGEVLVRLASLDVDSDQALEYLRKALRLSSTNIDARYMLIKLLFSCDFKKELENLVLETLDLRRTSGPMRHLGLVIQMAIKDDDYDDDAQRMNIMCTISSICSSSTENFNYLLEDLQIAIQIAKEQSQVEMWATLLLHHGITLACYSKSPSRTDQAIKSWKECAEIILAKIKHQSAGAILLDQVGRQLSCYYLAQLSTDPTNTVWSQKLWEVFQSQNGVVHGMSAAKTYLAAHLVRSGKRPEAEALFQENIKEAFSLLSDDTTGNDNRGFTLLFQVFLYTGDKVNALIAFSLLARRVLDAEILEKWLQSDEKTTTPEAMKLQEFYQENCGETAGIWSDQIQLGGRDPPNDDDTASKSYDALIDSMNRYYGALDDANNDYGFKNGEFKTPLCRIDHEWMQIPPWNAKAHVRAFRRRVCMGATIGKDGSLEGGREVPLVEWLNSLKEKWDPQRVWDFR
ncbi:uncharacterized protein N7479_009584 [Penicillium vulpinum]|uniref:uncharacterized protein n=1 Tax=Penicillium vulpinum TaxID=29845 RepID=UPI0025477CC4|nr:uncharacterized protein N7479_009584 [Penicillium vulpinum]KAJ5951171.1 hypothetical protein N7479_009584 [Penicillium vulpinum]